MNAGRDVERLIAAWLLEEAPGRAPDRVLESAAERIDQTSQRRFGAAWRDLMTISNRGFAAAAIVAVVAVAAALVFFRPSPSGVGNAPPTQSPVPTATATPAAPTVLPSQFTGACALMTRDEAEGIAGVVGLLPAESGRGDVTTCIYGDGGGDVIFRLTWTKAGGEATFDVVRGTPGVETVADLGDEALYDPATGTLHVRIGDAEVAIVSTKQGSTPASDRLAAEAIAERVAARM